MWLLKHRIAAATVALLLAACTSGNEGTTVAGARTFFADPVAVAIDGDCIAFHFFKRVKGDTGFDNDAQNPDTFIVGFTCGDNAMSFVDRFGFMSPAEAARIGRRHSI